MKTIFILLIALYADIVICRAQTSSFKGQVWSSNSAVRNFTVLVDTKSATTNDAGVFNTPINTSTTQVTVQLSSKNYIIVYPIGGKVLIPKDPALVTQIVIEPFQSNKYIQKYMAEFKQLKESAGKSSTEVKAIQTQLDSITQILYKFNYTATDLKNAQERQDGMDLFYPEITSTLQNYIIQARTVNAAFKFTAEYAFEKPTALEKLVQAINNYNPAYNKLAMNYPTYSRKIQDYWQDESLKTAFDGIVDTLINTIHKKTIFPLNELKTRINEYFIGSTNQDKAKAKKDIQDQIATIVPVLTEQINGMELRILQFQNQLKNY
ncbi:hypothetical protein SNE25_21515 [Mucilaginibacter sabulilitoris]|uniref:DUF4369 domain-containing protein n=1 Tax=Mucilaginibacter sabulilitoris TaxID=1173583 RepID=A0ABZ0TGL4_9SPHI|nr:hypothetical protein [Mucilaginibacter sabulilitoris]WPU91899.1 hypothetical protein SNE25_21515 [Mucilaginibacter sabulilitoris]